MVAAFRQHRVSRAQIVVAVPLPAQSACTTVRTVYYREYTRPNRCSLYVASRFAGCSCTAVKM